jgi:hypothetical protein
MQPVTSHLPSMLSQSTTEGKNMIFLPHVVSNVTTDTELAAVNKCIFHNVMYLLALEVLF